MGFSAGGHVASSLETHFNAGDPNATDPVERISCRPDFAILVYPVISMKDGITNAVCKRNLMGPSPDAALVESSLQRNAGDPANAAHDSLCLRGRSAGADCE